MVDLSKLKKQVKREGMEHRHLDSVKPVFWRLGTLGELFFQTLQNFTCSLSEDLSKVQSNFYVQCSLWLQVYSNVIFMLLLVWICYQRWWMETNDFHFQESTNVWKLWECEEFLQVRTVIVGSKINYHSVDLCCQSLFGTTLKRSGIQFSIINGSESCCCVPLR